jgi:hypothetical protein
MWPPTSPMVDTPLISIRGLSSVGRALPLQGRCQEFESYLEDREWEEGVTCVYAVAVMSTTGP